MEVLLVRNCPIPGRPSDPAPFHRHGRGERLGFHADVATAADCGAGGLSGEVPEVHRSPAMGLPWLWIFQSKYRINIEKIVFFISEATRVMKNDGRIKKYVIFHQFGWLTFQTWRLHKVKLPRWTLGWVGEILGSEAIEWPDNGGFLTTKSKVTPEIDQELVFYHRNKGRLGVGYTLFIWSLIIPSTNGDIDGLSQRWPYTCWVTDYCNRT